MRLERGALRSNSNPGVSIGQPNLTEAPKRYRAGSMNRFDSHQPGELRGVLRFAHEERRFVGLAIHNARYEVLLFDIAVGRKRRDGKSGASDWLLVRAAVRLTGLRSDRDRTSDARRRRRLCVRKRPCH